MMQAAPLDSPFQGAGLGLCYIITLVKLLLVRAGVLQWKRPEGCQPGQHDELETAD